MLARCERRGALDDTRLEVARQGKVLADDQPLAQHGSDQDHRPARGQGGVELT